MHVYYLVKFNVEHREINYGAEIRRSANFADLRIFLSNFNKVLCSSAKKNFQKFLKIFFIKICDNLQNCRFNQIFVQKSLKKFRDFFFILNFCT